MLEFIKNQLIYYGMTENMSLYLSNIIAVAVILFISWIVNIIAKNVLLKALRMYISKSKNKWDDIILENKVFEVLVRIAPLLVIYVFAPALPSCQIWIQRLTFCCIIGIILIAIDKLLNAVDDIYRNFEISKERPIKGYLQVVKIFAYCVGAIVIISIIIDRSPWVLLSGIGAATAVTLLIFQNSLLGLVATIQLSSNNMLKIGDWIEMSQYGADGEVIDISLHTVKVQNWDKTITTIPTHHLISGSFKNWRGMHEAGGRRIKRAIYIDMTSIKFCTEEMLERFEKIEYIKEYLENKKKEIDLYNKEHDVDPTSIVNGRRLTNIGTFRAYVEHYLNNHPKLNKGMVRVVRQLQPSEKGLPIEIYAFTKDTVWVNYEAVQSDIFDHILAVIPEFDLRIYQDATGYDIRSWMDSHVDYHDNKITKS